MFMANDITSMKKTTAKAFAGDVACMLLTGSKTTTKTTLKTTA